MTTMELEAYKAELAREILTTDNWHVLDEVKRVLGKIRKQSQAEEAKSKLKSELREALQEVKDAEKNKVSMSTMEDLYAELED
ncbi:MULTISPECIES: hypothetical protein [Parabacteroides]|uniref:Uncharacterized protein n=1 Tax=Parabacteroides gordonii MS-1 = DSM 23371 TaxID=1203610 RepID=A0A0F5ITB7_9BACT|nr:MULTISPECIES: hypothetical protein [Parabacteroides]KKB48525.1 hypothetical protein HMPREF1536_04686 [Parabacteroides gordonii MS-1 = DSM 23371]KKB51006.1 hypothetical protein HMPREF1212_01735 [Parabacteroides sp. HGS0025]MCA5585881.1 hypothetical protein [Parabacteroides gordonii]